MLTPRKILVFHTAFIGDIILTLPLVQVLRDRFPDAHITFVAIPSVSGILENHPAISEVIVYDKRGSSAGLGGILSIADRLRSEKFDVALIPHRSIRSAAIGFLARIPMRIGFSTSAGRILFTDKVPYEKGNHEITRNLSLLKPLGIQAGDDVLPSLYPGKGDRDKVDEILRKHVLSGSAVKQNGIVAVAPGSIWNTKRWLKENFIRLGKLLIDKGFSIVLVGGKEDERLCREIEQSIGNRRVLNAAGRLTPLQSAELIRRCNVAVSNDSAPMHMALAVRTPVVAIFGATVPQFGFAPRGEYDEVVETLGLPCRPCSIHGGERCPINTFVCMTNITPEYVFDKVRSIISRVSVEA